MLFCTEEQGFIHLIPWAFFGTSPVWNLIKIPLEVEMLPFC